MTMRRAALLHNVLTIGMQISMGRAMNKLTMLCAKLTGACLVLSLAACGADAGDELAPGDDAQSVDYEQYDELFEPSQGGKEDILNCKGFGIPDNGETDFQKRVALTFDDGPRAGTTSKVLDVLKAHDIKATFFVLGRAVEGSGEQGDEILQRMVDEGHILANHTMTHANMANVDSEQFKRELDGNTELLQRYGVTPRYFRFPFGSANCTRMAQLEEAGMISTGWTIDSADWCFNSAKGGVGTCHAETFRHVSDDFRDDMVGFVMNQARRTDGGVLLFHDVHGYTAEKLEEIILALKEDGFTFTNIDDVETFPLLNGVTVEPKPFIGDACVDDAGCDLGDDATGFCDSFVVGLDPVSGDELVEGFCSQSCEGFCPDRDNRPTTFCVSLDEGLTGQCVRQCNTDGDCLDNQACVEEKRHIGDSAAADRTATVCLPR